MAPVHPKRHLPILIGLGLMALALRSGFILETAGEPALRTPSPGMDVDLHWQAAAELREPSLQPPFSLIMESAPGFPLFLAAVRSVVGDSMRAVRFVMAAMGTVTVLLMYGLVWRETRSRIAAALSAAAMAVLPSLVFFDATLHKSGLELFLLTAALVWLRRDTADTPRSPLLSGTVGGLLLAGLLTCQWNTFLYTVAVVVYCLVLRGRPLRWRLTMCATILGIVAGSAIGIAWVGADDGLFAPQSGVHMRVGFHEGATGAYRQVPGIWGSPYGHVFLSRIEAEIAAGRLMTAGQANSYHLDRARAYILEHPLQAGALVLRKLGLVLNNYEAKGNEWFYLLRTQSTVLGILPLRFGALLIGAAWGGVAFWRRGDRDFLVLVGGIAASVLAANALSFVNWRYRLHVLIPMIALAGPGALAAARVAWRAFGTRPPVKGARHELLRWYALPGALAAVVAFQPVGSEIIERDRRWAEHNTRNSLAAEEMDRKLQSATGELSPVDRLGRVQLLRRLGRHRQAFAEVEILVGEYPKYVVAQVVYVEYLAHLGRPDQLREHLADLAATDPGAHWRLLSSLQDPVRGWVGLVAASSG